MAADQRYCLQCGERRGEPRVTLATPGARAPATRVEEVVAARAGVRSATTVWVAAVGVLVLALGVGVLIGRAGAPGSAPARAVPPITVTVPGAAAGAAAATPTPAAATHAKAARSGRRKGRARAATPTHAASRQELQNLDKLTPEQYQKKSKALPKVVGTQGKPPPKDHKAAGDGSAVETIG